MRILDWLTPQFLLATLAAVVLASSTPLSYGSKPTGSKSAGSAVARSGSAIAGFTEPYRNIDVAASEMGLIVAMQVREGDRVTAGQVLARLNEQVLRKTLEIAKASMESNGRLKAAKAEARMHQESLDQLELLLLRNHASQREIDRARAQRDMAEARLKATQEELAVKALDYERTQAQLEQRRVLAPIDGIVTQIYKDESEFVSPNDPTVVKIVQLDPLLIVFSVPLVDARNLAAEQIVQIQQEEQPIQGTVEFVSPMADAQSGTVRVRVRIPNPGETIPSGATCRLLLPTGTATLDKAPASP